MTDLAKAICFPAEQTGGGGGGEKGKEKEKKPTFFSHYLSK